MRYGEVRRHVKVPVPSEIRRAVIGIAQRDEACRILVISDQTYDALITYGGTVSAATLERVQERLTP